MKTTTDRCTTNVKIFSVPLQRYLLFHLHSKPTFLTREFNRVTKSALERDFVKCAINQSDVYLYWHLLQHLRATRDEFQEF